MRRGIRAEVFRERQSSINETIYIGLGIGMHSRVHAGRTGASDCETQGIPRARTLGRDRAARQADGILQPGES